MQPPVPEELSTGQRAGSDNDSGVEDPTHAGGLLSALKYQQHVQSSIGWNKVLERITINLGICWKNLVPFPTSNDGSEMVTI